MQETGKAEVVIKLDAPFALFVDMVRPLPSSFLSNGSLLI